MSFVKILILILAILGTPLFVVISALALLSFYGIDIDLSVVIIEMSRLSDTPLLLSLPLFIFAGTLLAESGTPQRLLRLSQVLLGWMPGGLAVVSLIVCAVFTAFTGASGVTIFALGGLLYPALLKDRYSERFSLGLITSSGSLGLLFPPSLPLILYGVISETRVDHLFLAGILPGILMLILLVVYSMKKGPVRDRGDSKKMTFSDILSGLKEAPGIMVRSMVLFGGILVVLAASMATTNYLVDQQVPMHLFEFIREYISSKYTFLLILNLFLLIVGSMLDIFSALVLVVPIIIPIAEAYGVDLTHLGIIFLTNLQIGYCTPPVGLNLFLASYRFDKSIVTLYRATLPFLALLMITLIIITYFPAITLFLVNLWG